MIRKVRGNIQASERIDIRSEGSLIGDVITARISIEDGAFFVAELIFASLVIMPFHLASQTQE